MKKQFIERIERARKELMKPANERSSFYIHDTHALLIDLENHLNLMYKANEFLKEENDKLKKQ